MKIFLPTKNDHLRLTEDWEIQLDGELWQQDLVRALHPELTDWRDRETFVATKTTLVVPKGTIIQLRSYEIRKVRVDTSAVTVYIWVSPDPRLSPISRGGTFDGGVSFRVRLPTLHQAEVEIISV